MLFVKLFLCLFTLQAGQCDWVSEWMLPVQEQINTNLLPKTKNGGDTKFFDEDMKILEFSRGPPEAPTPKTIEENPGDMSMTKLKLKLENTLQSATTLANTLKMQIVNLVLRENMLKEAIINGRLGVSMVTVTTLNKLPRSYIIRDGEWILCNGMIQLPTPNTDQTNFFNMMFSEPRCIGKETTAAQDPCVFNSIIKYETVPSRRALEYIEDDFFCLKTSFNRTVERYMSVTKRLMNETCVDGTIRSLAENNEECGLRVISEYSFYPHKSSSAANLPLEYCVEKDGSCKLVVAWHVSNVTIENFEFLKNEQSFKKYFIKTGQTVKRVNQLK